MHAPLAVIWRLLAFVGKELIETIRRPGALVSLVLGPFLIMAVFGAGFSGVRRPLETLIVVPDTSGLSTDTAQYQQLAGPPLHIAEVLSDRATAEARLLAGQVDVVVVAPADPEAAFRAGQRTVIEVLVDQTDPVEENYASVLAHTLADAVNQRAHRAGGRGGHGLRRRGRRGSGGGHPTGRRGGSHRGGADEPRAHNAHRDVILRAGRPGPDPAAPGRDARLDVARPRATERRDGAVPHLAGHSSRSDRGQGPRLRHPRVRRGGPDA